MTAFDAQQVRGVLRRLRGQWCTPPGVPRDLVLHVQLERLAEFHEWPSGHWRITQLGLDFLADNSCEHEGAA